MGGLAGTLALAIILRGAKKLTGENLKVVWAKFSTLSQAVFVLREIVQQRQARPRLELKTQPRFYSVIPSLSMKSGLYLLRMGGVIRSLHNSYCVQPFK